MDAFKFVITLTAFLFSGCSTVPKEVAQANCQNHKSSKACVKLYRSNFNGLVTGYFHPDAKKDAIIKPSDYPAYWVSIDKSPYAEYKIKNCNPPNQAGLVFKGKARETDFNGCILEQRDGPDLNFQNITSNDSSAYRERVRKTLNGQLENMFITSVISNNNDRDRDITFSITQNACSNVPNLTENNSEVFIDCSFKALNELEKDLTEKISGNEFTHVILLATGWNTVPSSSVNNYNEIIASITTEAKKNQRNFKPLVIGLTWPSKWLITKPGSYPNKANDADEIGLIWGNYLLNNTIPMAIKNSDRKPKFVAIGHSFGARILSTATVSQVLLEAGDELETTSHTLIMLQAAFSAKRFDEEGDSGHSRFLSSLEKNAEKIVMTSSAGDDLVNLAIHADEGRGHVSSNEAWDNICEPKQSPPQWHKKFACFEESKIPGNLTSTPSKIRYIKMDQSNISHGQVWGKEAAKIIWAEIR